MLKATILNAFVFLLILIKVSPKPLESDLTVDDYKSKCSEQCKKVSGEMDFDEETLTCKCTLITNVNEEEMAIVEQNVKLLNLNLKPSKDISKTALKNKRSISPNQDVKMSSKFEPTNEKDFNIVGEALPVLPPRTLPNRPLISRDAALRNLADIRKRLAHLSHHSSRNAAAHADAIRHNLKQLSNGIIVPFTPEQRLNRARINQERRARLNRLRTNNGLNLLPRRPFGVLGASADEDSNATTVTPKKFNRKQNNKNSGDVEKVIDPKNSARHGIITQPEEFIEN